MSDQKKISLTGVSIERAVFSVNADDYERAKREDRLANEIDVYLSDMDGETLVFEPDGDVINPHGERRDLVGILAPVLDLIPVHMIEAYLHRRGTPA